MPILDGFEACKQIRDHFDQEMHLFREEHKIKRPLFVAFSGFVDDETRLRCTENGFDLVFQAPLK